MLVTLLGVLASILRAFSTKAVRVSHRLNCISDSTERPLIGKSACFHRLDAALLRWYGNLAAIRSSRPNPFGTAPPTGTDEAQAPAGTASPGPSASQASKHMSYAAVARNGPSAAGVNSKGSRQSSEASGHGRENGVAGGIAGNGRRGNGTRDGHVLVGFCQLTQELDAGRAPSNAWGVAFRARSETPGLTFAVLVHVDDAHLQEYRRRKLEQQQQRERERQRQRLQARDDTSSVASSPRPSTTGALARRLSSSRVTTPVRSRAAKAGGIGEGIITYVAYFRPTTEYDTFCLAFDAFSANQRGRTLADAPPLVASAITRIGFSITRSTQTIPASEGDMTPFDLHMHPTWYFLV